MITGGSLEDSRNALNLAETRGNVFRSTKAFFFVKICHYGLFVNKDFVGLNVLSALLKMSYTARLAAIPHAAVSLSRIVNPSIYQD